MAFTRCTSARRADTSPLPDYDLSDANAVKLTLHGALVDEAYSRLLIQKTDLPLADILALDRVQKSCLLMRPHC